MILSAPQLLAAPEPARFALAFLRFPPVLCVSCPCFQTFSHLSHLALCSKELTVPENLAFWLQLGRAGGRHAGDQRMKGVGVSDAPALSTQWLWVSMSLHPRPQLLLGFSILLLPFRPGVLGCHAMPLDLP